MRNDRACVAHTPGICRIAAAFGAFIALTALLPIGFASPAAALPSFARQTGQPCGTCHTDFPALTPYGRRFKLLGYTVGGGMFRTTPFRTFPDNARAQAAKMGMYLKAANSGAGDDKDYVPPVSMMTIIGYTHTQAPLPPPTDPFKPNDNVVASPFSGFWGGAITDNIGAFAQVTYNAPPAGGFPDPFGHTWTWDNPDVRFVKTATIGGRRRDLRHHGQQQSHGSDVRNTTPSWAFPYAVSTIAGTRPARPSSKAHSRRMSPAQVPMPTQRHSLSGADVQSDPRFRGRRMKRTLEQWGQGYHAASGPPMPDIASKLSPNQIDALASYLSFVR
jgi:hypothetical protein